MRFYLLLLLTALPLLGACTPAAETVSYTLPPTPGGRMCTHQCVEARDYCIQSCDIKQRQCVMEVQTKAMSDYDTYARDQFSRHEPIDLNPSDFERQTPCTGAHKSCADACDKNYQTCYSNCGGQVNIDSSCQFLCF
jgi:hypothetical protein